MPVGLKTAAQKGAAQVIAAQVIAAQVIVAQVIVAPTVAIQRVVGLDAVVRKAVPPRAARVVNLFPVSQDRTVRIAPPLDRREVAGPAPVQPADLAAAVVRWVQDVKPEGRRPGALPAATALSTSESAGWSRSSIKFWRNCGA